MKSGATRGICVIGALELAPFWDVRASLFFVLAGFLPKFGGVALAGGIARTTIARTAMHFLTKEKLRLNRMNPPRTQGTVARKIDQKEIWCQVKSWLLLT